jgi:hypothetical protein
MHALTALAGLALIALVLIDGFEVMILPRRITRVYRLARFFYRTAWTLWRAVACRLADGRPRRYFLSVFGPASLLGLLVTWVLGLITGFALLHWSLSTPLHGPAGEEDSLASCFYLSGVTFFTLGPGDVTAPAPAGRALTIAEAGLGFGFLAVIIGYLPVLYQAFSRREAGISLLDARAGSPPTAAQFLLRRAQAGGGLAGTAPMLAEWERWAAELLESHLSFPVLSYYRSQHDNQSWLAALTIALDICALLLTGVTGADVYQARLTFAVSRHAAVDLASVFRTPPRPPEPDRLPPETLRQLRAALRQAGLDVREGVAADAKLAELRGLYEPFVQALGDHLLLAVPPVVPERVPVDNWQTSAWMRRAAGIGELPALNPDDDHAE